jgi:hypothetical protein
MTTQLTCNDLYKSVKTWSDLIDTNVAFMNGEIKTTFYQLGPLDPETYNRKIFQPCIELPSSANLKTLGVLRFTR